MRIDADVAVIGGGPAGLAAALSAHNAGAKHVVVLERDDHLGGILRQCIHNGFGIHYFGQELTGPEYAQRFIDELEGTGIRVESGAMVLEITPERLIRASSAAHGIIEVQAGAVVLAMGCRERTRGALNIPGSRPAGIYTAGSAQLLVNMQGVMPGNRVVILGSGDIGLIMARRMVWSGAKVELVCELMPYSSGLTRNIVQCLEDNDIPLLFEHTIVDIHGRERLEGVTIAAVDKRRNPIDETRRFVACDTLLLSVGLIPENELTRQMGVAMDPITGGAIVDENRQTSVPGVFACGNVLHVHDLVDNVSQEAQLAGRRAALYATAGSGSPLSECRVEAGEGVRYVVPQRIGCAPDEASVPLYFRTDRVYRDAQVAVIRGSQVIHKQRGRIFTPGEMQRVVLKPDLLNAPQGDLHVRIFKRGEEVVADGQRA